MHVRPRPSLPPHAQLDHSHEQVPQTARGEKEAPLLSAPRTRRRGRRPGSGASRGELCLGGGEGGKPQEALPALMNEGSAPEVRASEAELPAEEAKCEDGRSESRAGSGVRRGGADREGGGLGGGELMKAIEDVRAMMRRREEEREQERELAREKDAEVQRKVEAELSKLMILAQNCSQTAVAGRAAAPPSKPSSAPRGNGSLHAEDKGGRLASVHRQVLTVKEIHRTASDAAQEAMDAEKKEAKMMDEAQKMLAEAKRLEEKNRFLHAGAIRQKRKQAEDLTVQARAAGACGEAADQRALDCRQRLEQEEGRLWSAVEAATPIAERWEGAGGVRSRRDEAMQAAQLHHGVFGVASGERDVVEEDGGPQVLNASPRVLSTAHRLLKGGDSDDPAGLSLCCARLPARPRARAHTHTHLICFSLARVRATQTHQHTHAHT